MTKPADERTAKAREPGLQARAEKRMRELLFHAQSSNGTIPRTFSENQLTDVLYNFAEETLADAQHKVVCSFCGTITEYDHTQQHAQADAILAHIETCEKSPVRQLLGALAEIDRLNAKRSSAIKEAREMPSHEEIKKVLGNGWKGFKLTDEDDLDFVIGQIRLAIMKCDLIRGER